ncbi:MAG: DNA (cytosine-5-)-methyltransferase [Armatimonadota bacterium]|nr:DNA (cytosine-5-)-methyltransferase [Armatimonadota bacterium]
MMRYISLFSGIEAATMAWHDLGWKPLAFSEIEKFPCAVLAHHYPETPNLGDVTQIPNELISSFNSDLMVFGWPCTDVSIAGQRKGLVDDETGKNTRSGLFFDAVRLLYASGVRWFVAENVPGLLNSKNGKDFAVCLSEFTGLAVETPRSGWGNCGVIATDRPDRFSVAWSILDSQWFGVPQRRRRVFLIGYLGDWRPAAEVLSFAYSLSRHTPPCRKTREEVAGTVKGGSGERGYPDPSDGNGGGLVAPTIPSRNTAGGGLGTDFDCDGGLIVAQNTGHGYWKQSDVAQTIRTPDGGGSMEANIIAHSLSSEGFDASEDGTGRGTPIVPIAFSGGQSSKARSLAIGEVTPPLRSANSGSNQVPAISFTQNQCGDVLTGDVAPSMGTNQNATGRNTPKVMQESQDVAETLTADWHKSNGAKAGNNSGVINPVFAQYGVRRLTPRECERLQGFPDDFTQIPWRGKPAENCPDGPRYRALGNSMAVNVMRWLGERIAEVESILQSQKEADPQ